MSKIYIANYDPINLTNKLDKLKPLLKETKLVKHLYCDDGMYTMENNTLYRIEPSFNSKIEEKKVNNYTFIIDSTPINKLEVQSQLPISYIIKATSLNVYGGQGRQDTTLIVELIEDKVVGFYFLCKDVDFSNQFFKETMNEFLSVLF